MMKKGRTFASVWDALEDSPTEAANVRMRSDLMTAVRQAVAAWGVSQAEAAKRLQVTQPRLNDLLRGRITKFSLDALVSLAARAGFAVRMKIVRTAA
jgi:predicted XRE-type DNA-binding protein